MHSWPDELLLALSCFLDKQEVTFSEEKKKDAEGGLGNLR